tara:strand:+ start:560 stop:1552 length:993 start_codon:yes stop_codon:yes gene_type:complete
MEKLVTRAYNRFEIDEIRGVVRKISATSRLRDEIQYYTKLTNAHPQEAVFFPRMFQSSIEGEDYWMDLEMYGYPNLGKYLLAEDELIDWNIVFTKLREILLSWSTTHPYSSWTKDEITKSAYEMYVLKTEREQNAFVDGWKDKISGVFFDGTENGIIYINKKEYKPFELIWPLVKKYIEENILDFNPSIIHGDCCFSNILYNNQSSIIRFIDPRGSFGKVGIYGDIRYDVAKLYHSVDGTYESFINDKFEVTNDKNVHQLKLNGHMSNIEIIHALTAFEKTFFPQFDKKQIKTLQGCIFIGMCARHYDSLQRQHAMYLTGIRLLNEAMEL